MVVCTLDGLNLSDGTLYFVQLGFDPGEDELTYDEFPSYTGSVAIRNVSRAHIAQAILPVDVRGASEAAMRAGVDSINYHIGRCTFDAPRLLVYGADTYQIVDSKQVRPVHDELYAINVARLTLALNRLP